MLDRAKECNVTPLPGVSHWQIIEGIEDKLDRYLARSGFTLTCAHGFDRTVGAL